MNIAPTPIYAEVYQFLASAPTHEAILAFFPSEQAHQRLQMLLKQERGGLLSDDGRAELNEWEQVEHFVRMLKLHTRQLDLSAR